MSFWKRFLNKTEKQPEVPAPVAQTKSIGLKENMDYYFNEKGLMVFTAKYLLDRGYCCDNHCKHCPYRNNRP